MKLTKYNQRLLAILGTTILLISVFGFSMFIYESSFKYRPRSKSGILSNEITTELLAAGMRKELASYQDFILVDSVNLIYAIPVSSISLDEEEAISESMNLAFADGYFFEKPISKRIYFGKYCNLILYSALIEETELIFKERMAFSTFENFDFQGRSFLIFMGASEDTDQDGFITNSDLQSVYLIDLLDPTPLKIGFSKMGAVQYTLALESSQIVIEFLLDDGTRNLDMRPSTLVRYNFKTNEIENIIPNQIQSSVQKTLEGNSK